MTNLIHTLYVAQAKHTSTMLTDSYGEYGYGDDGYDYLKGALTVARLMLELDYEGNDMMLAKLLDPYSPDFVVNQAACDGICPEIYAEIERRHPGWEEAEPSNVHQYFVARLKADPDDYTLHKLSVNTPCGRACVTMIDRYAELLADMDPHPRLTEPLIESCRVAVSIAWRG